MVEKKNGAQTVLELWIKKKQRPKLIGLGLRVRAVSSPLTSYRAFRRKMSNVHEKKNINFVHVLLIKKKTFVTVTDAKGNKKTGASAGCLEERKGRSRLSRYAAEATAEHVGRSARKMGLKSVVMK
ncbi:hypothetical protein IEQ34_023227 [Dendrobium chrysotoxum]|uniref:Ribosomal protein S11 n=1 Tax=Dendrobium chrysotoxum TaxID=161865 RepID=A0AAV7FX04_DENCH|nr:hypothetical protein IEQ34_023227 [Dendrobium chrysotoxum]